MRTSGAFRSYDAGPSERRYRALRGTSVGPSDMAMWGPRTGGAGVGASQSPVTALTGAVVGALRDTGLGPSQARVWPSELLLRNGPFIGRQEDIKRSPVPSGALWGSQRPDMVLSDAAVTLRVTCVRPSGSLLVTDEGIAVRSGVWVDTALFRLASICRSAPGLLWFRTAKSGSSQTPCHGSSPAPYDQVRLHLIAALAYCC